MMRRWGPAWCSHGPTLAAEGSPSRQAVEPARKLQPRVASVDVHRRELIGFEATGQMLRRSASTPVRILSLRNDETRQDHKNTESTLL
jgi:DNA-binding NarL/FixJ family response regulator